MLRPVLASLLLILSAACAQVPKPQLQAYSEAFQAAQTAAAPMIADYAVAERTVRLAAMKAQKVDGVDDQGKPAKVGRFAAGYAADFQLADVPAVTTIGMPPGAEGVDSAFRAIAAYNETLVALAENRNIDEARGQLTSIIGDFSAVVPGAQALGPIAGAASDLVVNILGKAVEMDNRAQFSDLVLKGQPKVIALIDLLRNHTSVQYEMTTRELDRKAHKLEIGSEEQKALAAKIEAWRVVFADYVTLLNLMQARLDDLEAAVKNPKSQPLLARAQAGAGELRAYAEGLRRSITQLHAPTP